jgi:hypothetical protein
LVCQYSTLLKFRYITKDSFQVSGQNYRAQTSALFPEATKYESSKQESYFVPPALTFKKSLHFFLVLYYVAKDFHTEWQLILKSVDSMFL